MNASACTFLIVVCCMSSAAGTGGQAPAGWPKWTGPRCPHLWTERASQTYQPNPIPDVHVARCPSGLMIVSCDSPSCVAARCGHLPRWHPEVHQAFHRTGCSLWVEIGNTGGSAALQPLAHGWRVLAIDSSKARLEQLSVERAMNGHTQHQLAMVHTSPKQLGAVGQYLSPSVESGDAWVLFRVAAPTRRLLKQLAGILRGELMHGAILVHDLSHATVTVSQPSRTTAEPSWWRRVLDWVSSGFVPLDPVPIRPAATKLVLRSGEKVEAMLDELSEIGGLMAMCVRGGQLVAHRRDEGPLPCNDVLFVKGVLEQPTGERSIQRLWSDEDRELAEWPREKCPVPPVEFNWGDQHNLGNLLLLYLDHAATFLLAGCSAHIRIHNHKVTGSLEIPEFISYRPRGLCGQHKCAASTAEEPHTTKLSRYVIFVPKVPNEPTALSAVWHSPKSERLHAIEPLIKQLLTPQLVGWRAGPVDDESVVLHFRCSDSPMNLHWGSIVSVAPLVVSSLVQGAVRAMCDSLCCRYHFLKYKYYTSALQKMLPKDARPAVLMLSCSSWNLERYDGQKRQWPQLCALYTQLLVKWLRQRGHRVRVDCGESAVRDFARMVRAKHLISGGCTSSMAYLAALASHGSAVIPSMAVEKKAHGLYENDVVRQVVATPSMANHNYSMRAGFHVLDSTKLRLYHHEVNYDYSNVDLVDALLRS